MSSPRSESAAVPDARDAEIDRLLSKLDGVTQELFQARDAAVGAEAELGVALAKLREVEHRLHVSTIEADELRDKVQRLGAVTTSDGLQAPTTSGGQSRLSPLLGRSVKLAR